MSKDKDSEYNGTQLTTSITCRRKRTYYSEVAAKRARKRRNLAAGINYLRKYRCNVCNLWHLTTESKQVVDNE